jgi:hypothetical protein
VGTIDGAPPPVHRSEASSESQNEEHDFVEFSELHLIREREEADHHGTHVT